MSKFISELKTTFYGYYNAKTGKNKKSKLKSSSSDCDDSDDEPEWRVSSAAQKAGSWPDVSASYEDWDKIYNKLGIKNELHKFAKKLKKKGGAGAGAGGSGGNKK